MTVKIYQIVFMVLVLSFTALSAPTALTKEYDPLTRTVHIINDSVTPVVDIRLIDVFNESVNYEAVYRVTPHENLTGDNIRFRFNPVHSSGNPITELSFYLLKTANRTIIEDVPVCTLRNVTLPANGTSGGGTSEVEDCSVNHVLRRTTVRVWDDFNFHDFRFIEGRTYHLKVNAVRQMMLGRQNSDVLPTFLGLNLPEFTWWDVNAFAKTNITVRNNGPALTDFTFNATRNLSGQVKSCIDPVFVNQTENEALFYELENNTCILNNNSVWWVRSSRIPAFSNETYWLYHNFTSPADQSNRYKSWNASYVHVFHLSENETANNLQINSRPAPNGTAIRDGFSGAGRFGLGYVGYGNNTGGGSGGVQINNGWSTSLISPTTITVEVWFNPAQTATAMALLGAGDRFAVHPNQGGAGAVRFYAINDAGVMFDNLGSPVTGQITAGEWYFYVFKWDGARAYIYKNGESIQNLSLLIGSNLLDLNTSTLTIGSGGSGGIKSFNGSIDEFRVSNVNKSDAEIKALYLLASEFGATETNVFPPVPPNITVFDPVNTTYANPTRYLNVSANTTIDKWWYKLNGGANTSFTPNTTFLAVAGSNELRVYANDTINENGTIGQYHVNFTIDLDPPVMNLTSPTNSSYTITNITLSLIHNSFLPDLFWYNLNGNTTSVFFIPNTTFLGVEGNNSINVFMNDTQGQSVNVSVNFYINTTIPPTPDNPDNLSRNVLLYVVLFLILAVGTAVLALM